jgi:hypothetical protein
LIAFGLTGFGFHHAIEHELDGVHAHELVVGLFDQLGVVAPGEGTNQSQKNATRRASQMRKGGGDACALSSAASGPPLAFARSRHHLDNTHTRVSQLEATCVGAL